MADGYKYDVFISYRRSELWPEWVENTFMPLFKHYLDLDRPGAKIFVDYEMETGNSWPIKLSEGLSHSKVLVGLWTKPYFVSEWCLAELALMYAREKECGFNTSSNSQRLIIPASLHDGGEFPDDARMIQQKQLQEYSHVWLADGSQKKEDLSTTICGWVHDIIKPIEEAPSYNADWAEIAYDEFMETFKLSACEQSSVPNVGND